MLARVKSQEERRRYIRQRKTVFQFRWRVEASVEQANTRANHAHLQAQIGEVLEEVLQWDIVDLKAIPDLVNGHFMLQSSAVKKFPSSPVILEFPLNWVSSYSLRQRRYLAQLDGH